MRPLFEKVSIGTGIKPVLNWFSSTALTARAQLLQLIKEKVTKPPPTQDLRVGFPAVAAEARVVDRAVVVEGLPRARRPRYHHVGAPAAGAVPCQDTVRFRINRKMVRQLDLRFSLRRMPME